MRTGSRSGLWIVSCDTISRVTCMEAQPTTSVYSQRPIENSQTATYTAQNVKLISPPTDNKGKPSSVARSCEGANDLLPPRYELGDNFVQAAGLDTVVISMEPFNWNCDIPEEGVEVAVITFAEKRQVKVTQQEVKNLGQDEDVKNVKLSTLPTDNKGKPSSIARSCEGAIDLVPPRYKLGDNSMQAAGSDTPAPSLKRPARGCRSIYKKRMHG